MFFPTRKLAHDCADAQTRQHARAHAQVLVLDLNQMTIGSPELPKMCLNVAQDLVGSPWLRMVLVPLADKTTSIHAWEIKILSVLHSHEASGRVTTSRHETTLTVSDSRDSWRFCQEMSRLFN
jgi:hypothetical protein